MSKVSGHGGYIVRDGAPPVRVDNSSYEVDTEAVIDEVTDSQSAGVAQGLPILVKLNSLTFEVPEDSVAFPQALGVIEGTVLSFWLRRGALAQWDYVTGTIVRTVRVTNDQQKARRVAITCEYGSLARNVAGPAGFN